MNYVIGIDGGGTKTRIRLADLAGNPLACHEGGPTNINSMDKQQLQDTLYCLINEGLKAIQSTIGECRSLCMGMAGAGRPQEQLLLSGICDMLGFRGVVTVTDDAHTALYGGTGQNTGIILISGTGSICYGRDLRGETYRAGGWGYLIGDEGSGYDIGLKALKHMVRAYDGREEDSILSSLIMSRLGLRNCEELIALVYRSGDGKKIISGLADLVDEAFNKGDPWAERILKQAVNALILCARAVIEKMNAQDDVMPLAMGGSVLSNSLYIKEHVKVSIETIYPRLKVHGMKNDAAWGAVLLALDQIHGKET